MGEVTKRLATDDSLLLLVDAVKNTETVQQAKTEIQSEGDKQVKNIQDAASEVITDINQLAKNTSDIAELSSNLDNLAYGENGVHNLLNPTLQSTTKNGITCTNNGDGTYTFNGTVDSGAYPEFNLGMITLDKGEYLFTNQDSTIYLWCGTSKGIDDIINRPLIGGTFINIKNKSDIYISLVCSSGETYHNVVIKPMITEDLTATYDDFVPYIPSVKMLADEVSAQNESLSVIGKCKNLLNPTLKTTTQNGVTCTNNGDGTYTLNGTATQNTTFNVYIREQDWEVGKTYRIIGCPSGGSRNSYFISPFHGYSSDSLTDYGNGCTFTVTDDVKSYTTIIIFIRQGNTFNNLVFKPMLTTNLSATYDDFVPYTGDGDTLTADVAELKNDLSVKKFDLVADALWLCVSGKHCVLTLNGYNLTETTHFDKLEEYQPYLVARNVVSKGDSVCMAAVDTNGNINASDLVVGTSLTGQLFGEISWIANI